MPVSGSMQYVLLTSAGKYINVFYDEGQGICISVLNRRNRWTMPQVAVKNCMPWLSACLDEGNNLHIAFQDLRGDIAHMVHRGGAWQRNTVLQAKKPAKYDKHIHVTCEGNVAYLFYVIKHDKDNILSFQTVSEKGAAGRPHALDCIVPGGDAYALCRNGNYVCLGYNRVMEGKTPGGGIRGVDSLPGDNRIMERKTLPGYRWFSITDRKAYEFIALPEEGYCMESLVAESREKVHFCISERNESGFALYYMHRDEKKGEWSQKTLISKSNLPYKIPTIQLLGDKLLCFWIQGKLIKGFGSADGGKTWEDLQDYPWDGRSGIHLACYADCHSRTRYFSQFNRVLCRFSNGIKIIYSNGEEKGRAQESLEASHEGTARAGTTREGTTREGATREGTAREGTTCGLAPNSIKDLLKENENLKNRLEKVEEALFNLKKRIDIHEIEIEKLRIAREPL